MRLQQQAAGLGGERAVIDPGRPHAIGRPGEGFAALPLVIAAADQVARHQEYLFPVLVHKRHGRERARLDLEDARAVADLVLLVKRAGQNLLGEAPGIARNLLEALGHAAREPIRAAALWSIH